jgi:1-acyl-sn-glycerol-3-phosphate acyltransferase
MLNLSLREKFLIAFTLLLTAIAAFAAPIAELSGYFAFADQRELLGLPRAMDVLSNLPFLLAGLYGLVLLTKTTEPATFSKPMAAVFFTGLILTSIGSAYFHLLPQEGGRLAVDRSGMLIAFTGLVGLATALKVSLRAGTALAFFVGIAGAVSIYVGNSTGNVLPWALVQFGGLGLIIGFASFKAPKHQANKQPKLGLWWIVVVYAAAKAFEMADQPVFDWTQHLISGHSLKHIVASLAAWPVIAFFKGNKNRSQDLIDATFQKSSMNPQHSEHSGQFELLKQKRFAPFFWTQFIGAANDNLFKFAFTVMVTYQLSISWLKPEQAGLVIGALFILPFLLFSATSGQLADKYDKRLLILFIKWLEIGIMILAGWGFIQANVAVLLACTFLMGLHSTLFGPVKFAYLPQHLNERELTGGNGMVEMGTFVAILIGQVIGGLLIAIPHTGAQIVAGGCVALAVLGRLVAHAIPASAATEPNLNINWNPVTETWRNLKLAKENKVVFRSLLGISWMWFFGAVFLSQFPSFAKEVLHANEQVASLLLVVFSIGIGIGSLLCEVLSRRHVEIGLVPLGAIGMSIFSIDLYVASRGLPPASNLSLSAFIGQAAHWRVMADLALLSLFAGLYSVPMYALIQMRSQPTHRARIIAANNILTALFMIASSVIVGLLLKAGFTIPQVFLFVGIANAVVAFYIFMLVPEYFLRFVAWMASRLGYRFKVRGDENIPAEGAAILVCNHVSFVDAVLLMAASPRPIYFVMDHKIFRIPVLGAMFKLAKAIPIAPQKDDAATYKAAFEAAAKVLREGDLLAIFPEGGITRDGKVQTFKGGIMKILELAKADGLSPPVIPMALTNLWGSFFSRVEEGNAMVRPFRRGVMSRVGLNVGEPVSSATVNPEMLQSKVERLLVG